MSRTVLVLLKRNERVEGMLPYLNTLTQPGMKVLFIIPYPVELWRWLRDYWVTTESTRDALFAGRKILEHYSWEKQQALAEQKVLPAREALGKQGVEVSVDLLTGSLANVFKDHKPNGEVQWVIMRQGNGMRVKALFHRVRCLVGLESHPRVSPVLVFLANPSV